MTGIRGQQHGTGPTGPVELPHRRYGRWHATSRGRRPVRPRMIFATVATALVMFSLDSTIVATALGALRDGLGTSINWAGWTITAYSLGLVVMLPISGRLADRFGYRRVFLASLVMFTLASLACAAAPGIGELIVFRAAQAIGGAGFTPAATGILVRCFGSARDRAVSLYGSVFSVGSMIGPVLGGVFVTTWTWRGIFLVNAPVGALVLALGLRFIPADPPRRTRRGPGHRFDLAGVLLLASGLTAGMLTTSLLGDGGAPVTLVAAGVLGVVAVVALAWFVRHIRRRARPFIPARLVIGSGFAPVNAVNLLFGGISVGCIALVPLYAADRYGLPTVSAGLLLVAQGVADVALTLVAALTLRRTGYRAPMYAGATAVVAGIVLLALPPVPGIAPFWWLAGATTLVGIGTGVLGPASRNAGLQLAPAQSATIAALRTMQWQLGSIIAVSASTAVLAATGAGGRAQAWIYLCVGGGLVGCFPLIRRVREHFGAW